MAQAVGELCEELGLIRERLAVLAKRQVDPRFRGKIDLSGVVQQTLLEAHRAWDQLRQMAESQRCAWLDKALVNNLTDEVRKLGTGMRDFTRERSLESAADDSSPGTEAWLAADESSPSERAIRDEQRRQ